MEIRVVRLFLASTRQGTVRKHALRLLGWPRGLQLRKSPYQER